MRYFNNITKLNLVELLIKSFHLKKQQKTIELKCRVVSVSAKDCITVHSTQSLPTLSAAATT